MTIKAVLFDIGNTLVKYDVDSPEQVFQRVLAALGISSCMHAFENPDLQVNVVGKYSWKNL